MATYDDYAVVENGVMVDEVERIKCIAPNLSALVGSVVAVELEKAAGCLDMLARLAPNNVASIGYLDKKSETSLRRVACLESTELYSRTPPKFRLVCLRLLAGKAQLAARVDCTGQDPTGNTGRELYDVVARKLSLSC